MKDALLLVDLIQRFDHRDGDKLLASARERLPAMLAARDDARSADVPVVYVNDIGGRWDADFPGLVRDALEAAGGDVIEQIAPQQGDRAVLKARYSAFDHTPLVILLRELEIERIVIAGAATEMCVTQTAIDARELGFKVTVLSDACARIDEELERLSLIYAERVLGAFVGRVEDWQPATPVARSF
jgi:nicotinamidase-related amidase